MNILKKIVDHEPDRPVYEFSVVIFKKLDTERGSKKGYVGTVVDMVNYETYGYTVETPSGDTASFYRHEFRLATPENLARYDAAMERRKASAAAKEVHTKPPAMPEKVEHE